MSCGCQTCALLIKEAFARRVREAEGEPIGPQLRRFCQSLRHSRLQDAMVLTILLEQVTAELAGQLGSAPHSMPSRPAAVVDAIDQFERQTLAALDPEPARPSLSPVVRRLLNLIADHGARPPTSSPLTVTTLASVVGCSAPALSRQFQRETGESLRAYLLNARMRRASTLVLQGEKVDVVAIAVGYRSKSAFLRAFRRHTGTTPGTLRRRCIQAAGHPDA